MSAKGVPPKKKKTDQPNTSVPSSSSDSEEPPFVKKTFWSFFYDTYNLPLLCLILIAGSFLGVVGVYG